MVLYLVCAKADHVDPNQMRGLLSPLYRSFRRDFFTVIPYDAIVNQCWDLHSKGSRAGLYLTVFRVFSSRIVLGFVSYTRTHVKYLYIYIKLIL